MPLGKLRVIPLGVEDAFFSKGGQPRSHLLHVGSADPRDNTTAVVEGYGRFVENRSSDVLPLVIVGDLGHLVPEVRRVVMQHGLQDKVRLVGRVSDNDLVEYYGGASVCIQPATDEGFGLQPLEAMAAGCAVVALRDDAVTELLGEDGTWIRDATPEEIAAALEALISEPRRLSEVGARLAVRARLFDWDRTARAVDAVLVEALDA